MEVASFLNKINQNLFLEIEQLLLKQTRKKGSRQLT